MSSRWVEIAGWLAVAAGFALMTVHYFAGSPGDPEGWLAAAGFGAPFVGAGGLALVGERRSRPTLCVAAGIALAIMSMVSIIALPLLIVAGFMIAAARHTGPDGSFALPGLLAAGLVAVFGYLVFHQDPVTWSTPTGSGASSNVVTSVEAVISLTVVVAIVLAAMAWSARPNSPAG